jgi:hypothetical protein
MIVGVSAQILTVHLLNTIENNTNWVNLFSVDISCLGERLSPSQTEFWSVELVIMLGRCARRGSLSVCTFIQILVFQLEITWTDSDELCCEHYTTEGYPQLL